MKKDTLPRRDRLVDAALVVFARKGVDAANIKEIGSEAGVAPGLIYHYFPNKGALLAAAVERHGFLPQLRQMLVIPPTTPATDVLPEIARRMYALLTERVELLRVVMARAQTHVEMRERVEELTREAQGLLVEYLRARAQAGELRPHAYDVAARMLLFTVVMWRLADSPPDQLTEAIRLLLNGLTP
jgi:TetR/AcrR family transcriptional regulator, cholesterol catabolism regulator